MEHIKLFTSAKNANSLAYTTAIAQGTNAVVQWKLSNLTLDFLCDCKWRGELRVSLYDARGHVQCPQCHKHFFIGPCLKVTGPVSEDDWLNIFAKVPTI